LPFSDRFDVAVDALQIVHVVDADFLEARGVFAANGFRRAKARLDRRALAFDSTAELRQRAAGASPGCADALFLVVVLSVESRLADAVSLCQQSRVLVVKVRGLLGVAAGLEFRLHVLVGFLLVDAFLFDFGFGLVFDFEPTDVCFDTGGECVPDALDVRQCGLVGTAHVVDRLEARLAERFRFRGTDTADVGQLGELLVVRHQASPRLGFCVM